MKKYNVGDKVRIVETPNEWWREDGKMNHWCGKTMTIREVLFGGMAFFMEEDKAEHSGHGWMWGEEDFTEFVESDKPTEGGEEVKSPNPMPKLENGMFVKHMDGDLGVFVNGAIIYQNGYADLITTPGVLDSVDAVYEFPCCFQMIKDGEATAIWERTEDNPKGELRELLETLKKIVDKDKHEEVGDDVGDVE